MRGILGILMTGLVSFALISGCGGEAAQGTSSTGSGGGHGGGGGSGHGGGGGRGGSSSSSHGAGGGPTFSDVYQKVIGPAGCAEFGICHAATQNEGFRFTPEDTAYQNLVGHPSQHPDCGAGTRVVPGDPDKSVLYIKLAHAQPPLECWRQMWDTMNEAIKPEQLELVRAWIEAGAPK